MVCWGFLVFRLIFLCFGYSFAVTVGRDSDPGRPEHYNCLDPNLKTGVSNNLPEAQDRRRLTLSLCARPSVSQLEEPCHCAPAAALAGPAGGRQAQHDITTITLSTPARSRRQVRCSGPISQLSLEIIYYSEAVMSA